MSCSLARQGLLEATCAIACWPTGRLGVPKQSSILPPARTSASRWSVRYAVRSLRSGLVVPELIGDVPKGGELVCPLRASLRSDTTEVGGTRLRHYIGAAFASDRTTCTFIVAIMVLINAIVLHNAVFHPPTIGYDAGAHLRYAATLANFRLPGPEQSAEFFSPPLAYFLTTLGMVAANLDLGAAARVGLVAQVVVSLLVCFFVLRLCELLRPGESTLKIAALFLCGLPAVYYKTFSQIRGEPWLALFGVILACDVLHALRRDDLRLFRGVSLGVICGLALLSRQWGALLLIGVACFAAILAVRRRTIRTSLGIVAAAALVVAFLASGWFYLSLRARYGSFQTFAIGDSRGVEVFNGPRNTFSLSNAPPDFYLGAGRGKLFTEPVRPAFANQLGPIFYSEIWGDYWSFFLVKGYDRAGTCVNGPRLERAVSRGRGSTNRSTMGAYLGRVNLIALLPSGVFLAGLLFGVAAAMRTLLDPAAGWRTCGLGLVGLLVLASLVGYVWFVVSHYGPGGSSTIKATYMFQVFPLLAVLGAECLVRIRDWWRPGFLALAAALLLVAVHNGPTTVTRYASWLDPICGQGRSVPVIESAALEAAALEGH